MKFDIFFSCSTGNTISVLAIKDRQEKKSGNKEYIIDSLFLKNMF